MKLSLFALALCGLVMPLSAADEKPAVVKELDIKGLKIAGSNTGAPTKPTQVTNADELAKAVPDADAQAALKKQVDLTRQNILIFAWAGSGGDTLSANVPEGKNAVTFVYKPGRTRDLRRHVQVFALAKDATWKVAPAP